MARWRGFSWATAALLTVSVAAAQPPGGGFGPPGGQPRQILKDFDKDKNGWLNNDERKEAREAAKKTGRPGGGGFRPGGGGFGPRQDPPKAGPKVAPADVKNYTKESLYEPTVLRTIFIDFDNKNWESELEDFHNTDVDVPATVTVDGKKYPNVGVSFRGMSSYMGVGAGYKRSLNLAMDMANGKQQLYGYKNLNLNNGHDDASFLNSVLYSHIARQYTPAPKANMVKVVINGESWGVYSNVQQFDKVFLKENYKTTDGTRWKVSGSPNAAGGLEYIGDKIDDYKRRYEIKSKDDDKAWTALINLCKVLKETPPDKLEKALEPLVDMDNLLWFLALDVALINCDGYWIRSSDYSIYLDPKGKFHFIPHDMNEAFRPGMGPGFGGPGGGGGGFGAPPRPGEVLPPRVQDDLKLTDEQKKQLEAIQKEVDAQLEKLMTEDQRKQFKEMRERGPGGFGPGGFGPGGGGPGGGGMRPGGGMGGGGGGVTVDPLVGLTDARKPLRSKVLAVPSLRTKYLQNVRKIAEDALDWKKLGPVVADYRKLLEKEIEADTRKLVSYEAFKQATADEASTTAPRGREFPLRAFADQRRKYLLDYKETTK